MFLIQIRVAWWGRWMGDCRGVVVLGGVEDELVGGICLYEVSAGKRVVDASSELEHPGLMESLLSRSSAYPDSSS